MIFGFHMFCDLLKLLIGVLIGGEKIPNGRFKGIVSQAFDDFMYIYTKQVER